MSIFTWIRKFVATRQQARYIASHTYTCSACGTTIITRTPPVRIDGEVLCCTCASPPKEQSC